ncbi:hypothetical protein GCM10010297_20620 [Streptomyces malachitofuscus]|nr:hypothetical protein GCM10010297_20620 [Streptomyces malachitofuscus]
MEGDTVARSGGDHPEPGPFAGLQLGGARLHRRLWLALSAGALMGVAFVHWLVLQSLYELNTLCPYCALVRIVTIAGTG